MLTKFNECDSRILFIDNDLVEKVQLLLLGQPNNLSYFIGALKNVRPPQIIVNRCAVYVTLSELCCLGTMTSWKQKPI